MIIDSDHRNYVDPARHRHTSFLSMAPENWTSSYFSFSACSFELFCVFISRIFTSDDINMKL